MGASGGGCVLILCPQGGGDAVRVAVQSLGELLDFRIDEDGVSVQDSA